jgi:hypothetical protein
MVVNRNWVCCVSVKSIYISFSASMMYQQRSDSSVHQHMTPDRRGALMSSVIEQQHKFESPYYPQSIVQEKLYL